MAPRRTKYARVPTDGEKGDLPIDNDDAASSSSSINTIDLEDEASPSAHPPPPPPPRRSWKTTVPILALGLGWFATALAWHQSSRSPLSLTSGFRMYTNTPIPQDVFKPVRRVFDKDERYMGGGREADAAWDALVAGHDAVWIENPQQWGLGEGIVAPYDHPNTPVPKPQDFYVISILHQLHCLNMIRFQYYQEKDHHAYKSGPATGGGEDAQTSFKWKVHVEHCFEYLRQGISCGGDLIIEGNSPIKVGKGHATSVTGWGVEHDCINFELLRKFQIEQEAKYNETWQSP